MADIKETFDMAIGKASKFVSDNADKVAAFVGEQKDKAVEYFDSKQKLYETKTALDAANKKLDNLFGELGRVSYYKRSTVPGRVSADIRLEIKTTLAEVASLEEAYASMKPAEDKDTDDEDEE